MPKAEKLLLNTSCLAETKLWSIVIPTGHVDLFDLHFTNLFSISDYLSIRVHWINAIAA